MKKILSYQRKSGYQLTAVALSVFLLLFLLNIVSALPQDAGNAIDFNYSTGSGITNNFYNYTFINGTGDLSAYALLNGSNQPFTGQININVSNNNPFHTDLFKITVNDTSGNGFVDYMKFRVGATSYRGGGIVFGETGGGMGESGIDFFLNQLKFYQWGENPITFFTNDIERMRIDGNGNVKIQKNWDGSNGALTLSGDKPTIRFDSTRGAGGNQKWLIHVGDAPDGGLTYYTGTDGSAWTPVYTVDVNGNFVTPGTFSTTIPYSGNNLHLRSYGSPLSESGITFNTSTGGGSENYNSGRIVSKFDAATGYSDGAVYIQNPTGAGIWKTGLKIKDGNIYTGKIDTGNNISIGTGVTNTQPHGTSIGFGSSVGDATKDYGIAIGPYASSTATQAYALGTSSAADGENCLSFGYYARCYGYSSLSILLGSTSYGGESIAIGYYSNAGDPTNNGADQKAIVLGTGSFAQTTNSVTIGNAINNTFANNFEWGVSDTKKWRIDSNGDLQGLGHNITAYNLCYSNGTGCPVAGANNIFNQQLNTTSAPQFDNVTITNRINASEIVVVAIKDPILTKKIYPQYLTNKIINETEVNIATTNATSYNATIISYSLAAQTNYTIDCNLFTKSAAATTGVQLNISSPATPNVFNVMYDHPTNTTVANYVICTGTKTDCVSEATSSSTTGLPVRIHVMLDNVNSGVVTLKLKSEVAGSLATVIAGSYCTLEEQG